MLAPSASAEPSRDDAVRALDEVVAELNKLDTWFTGAEQQRLGWLKDVEAADRSVIDVNTRIDALQAEMRDTETALTELASQEVKLNANRLRQAELIAEHLGTAYRLSGQDFAKTLLNQQSADNISRMMRYHRYFSAARLDTLAEYQSTLTELANVRIGLVAANERIAGQSRRMTSERAALVEQRTSRQLLLRRLESEIANNTTQRKRLKADQDRLQNLVETLQKRAGQLDGAGFAANKGRLPWPVPGKVQHRYGKQHSGGRLSWHGTRFSTVEGVSITAVYRGRVVFSDWLRGYGLLTIVDHGGGFMTLYGHADVLTKNVGDWVEGGEILGRAGQSSGQATNGVYFEVRQDGKHVNPTQWLTKSG